MTRGLARSAAWYYHHVDGRLRYARSHAFAMGRSMIYIIETILEYNGNRLAHEVLPVTFDRTADARRFMDRYIDQVYDGQATRQSMSAGGLLTPARRRCYIDTRW